MQSYKNRVRLLIDHIYSHVYTLGNCPKTSHISIYLIFINWNLKDIEPIETYIDRKKISPYKSSFATYQGEIFNFN